MIENLPESLLAGEHFEGLPLGAICKRFWDIGLGSVPDPQPYLTSLRAWRKYLDMRGVFNKGYYDINRLFRFHVYVASKSAFEAGKNGQYVTGLLLIARGRGLDLGGHSIEKAVLVAYAARNNTRAIEAIFRKIPPRDRVVALAEAASIAAENGAVDACEFLIGKSHGDLEAEIESIACARMSLSSIVAFELAVKRAGRCPSVMPALLGNIGTAIHLAKSTGDWRGVASSLIHGGQGLDPAGVKSWITRLISEGCPIAPSDFPVEAVALADAGAVATMAAISGVIPQAAFLKALASEKRYDVIVSLMHRTGLFSEYWVSDYIVLDGMLESACSGVAADDVVDLILPMVIGQDCVEVFEHLEDKGYLVIFDISTLIGMASRAGADRLAERLRGRPTRW